MNMFIRFNLIKRAVATSKLWCVYFFLDTVQYKTIIGPQDKGRDLGSSAAKSAPDKLSQLDGLEPRI